ncbi:MAG: hypothetical protein QOJ91_1279 [Sphingomonadales bacterium]|jgi:hypothetical protein|nr:hypothetical protein [Sphingomonadales bacterium]
MLIFRYLLYLAYIFVAIMFWLIGGALFLDFSMGDPVCLAEGVPCPVPSAWEQGVGTLFIFSVMPLTALGFVFYRRAVRGMMGLE